MQQTLEKIRCEICDNTYEMSLKKAKFRSTRKIANGRFLCVACTKNENVKRFSQAGKKALENISKEDRIKNASLAGKISASRYDPLLNNGRFSTRRWNEKSAEEQREQVMRASNALQENIRTDATFREHYYNKTYSNRKIGYTSKGQLKIYDALKDLGFELEYRIDNMTVDICNQKLKIVIEYNGDYWHCNPRTWKEDDYNSSIKMYAKDKWRSDFARYKKIESFGYTVIVVWEKEWKLNPDKYLKRIYNEIDAKNHYSEQNVLRYISQE